MNVPLELQPYAHLITPHVSLSEVTYMKVGGSADWLAPVTDISDFVNLIRAARLAHLNTFILGGGSNTVFTDAGFRGLVIVNRCSRIDISPTGEVLVESGATTNAVVNQTVAAGLAGLEVFLGIPGSIGGAVYNNSHFLSELISNSISQVEVLDRQNQLTWVSKSKMDFGYEHSRLQETDEVVTRVKFSLKPSDAAALFKRAHSALNKRQQTQPLSVPSSGCFFQNPPGQSAGALIDQAGLKGYRIGGAEVSSVHANFIVNTNQATSKDIVKLANHVSDTVARKFSVFLKPEVFLINEVGERIHP